MMRRMSGTIMDKSTKEDGAPKWVSVTLGTACLVAVTGDIYATLVGSNQPNAETGQIYRFTVGAKGTYGTVYLSRGNTLGAGLVITVASLAIAIVLPVYIYYVIKKVRAQMRK